MNQDWVVVRHRPDYSVLRNADDVLADLLACGRIIFYPPIDGPLVEWCQRPYPTFSTLGGVS